MQISFWRNNSNSSNGSKVRKISASRILGRSKLISKYAKQVQKCEEEIAKINSQIEQLSGKKFTRAGKELLMAKRQVAENNMNFALAYLTKEKALMDKNVKHNKNLIGKRLG